MKNIRSLVMVLAALAPFSLDARLAFSDFHGTWRLFYRGNYGYEFSFNRSYRAYCAIRLQGSMLFFRGVYTLDESNNLRINVSEMKNQELGARGKYAPVASSYFIFEARRFKEGGRDFLELRPRTIVINGNNSDGYFEPVIKLAK